MGFKVKVQKGIFWGDAKISYFLGGMPDKPDFLVNSRCWEPSLCTKNK